MKYIDIHCHLDFVDYGDEIYDVLARMKESDVGAITIGTDLESSKRAVKIAAPTLSVGGPTESVGQENNIWACVGMHPIQEISSPDQGEGRVGFDEEEFEKLVSNPKVVGIGECGLDFFRTKPENLAKEKERQTKIFRQQIEFALKHDKPLMLHCRDAYNETLEILNAYASANGKKLRGNCHFFAGTPEQAKKFTELNFSCSFTGVITFTHDYDEAIKSLPKEFIMAETDAPFVAPVPYRGKRNQPSYVVGVYKKIAEIRGEDPEIARAYLVENAKRIFGLN